MRRSGFWLWLVLFLSGSLLFLWSRPWAEVMGRFTVFAAVFVGISASMRRTATRSKTARALIGVQLANMLPMCVVGSSPSPSPVLKVAYLVSSVVVLVVNAYVFFGREQQGAG